MIAEARTEPRYRLDEQVGFLLRKASQRHVAIFAQRIADLTPPQFAVLARLAETGETSQNRLGQMVAMDAATIKGVIDRLKSRGYVEVADHDSDRRRVVVGLTAAGRAAVASLLAPAREITRLTLAPLTSGEAETLARLLAKIG